MATEPTKSKAKKSAAQPSPESTKAAEAEKPEKPTSQKREAPAVLVPGPSRNVGRGIPTTGIRQLQTMLADLGYYKGRINGYLGNDTRDATSVLQQRLIADGHYDGIPDGAFNEATRAALLSHPDIPTRTV